MASILLGACLALGAPASSQCALNTPAPLGRVFELEPTPLPGGSSASSALALRVLCLDLPAIEVDLRVYEPPAGVPLQGTVLFGIGGPGVGFYADLPGGLELFGDLTAAGFRVVERSWRTGWFDDGGGVRRQSDRYATLLRWVYENLHTAGAFCAAANSGGSSEIAFALTTWDAATYLDVAVLGAGPSMARLDFACGSSGAWTALCPTVVNPDPLGCASLNCFLPASSGACDACSVGATAEDLYQDSVLHANALLQFPMTRVHIVVGAVDCGPTVAMSHLFYDAVTSEKVLEVAQNTPHWIPASQEGRDAILRALLGGVAPGSGPATLAAPAWPRPGKRFQLDLRGPVLGSYALFSARSPGLYELPGLGWAFLDDPVRYLTSGSFTAEGRATRLFRVPNNPSLVGLDVYLQAVIEGRLSNLVHTRVLP